MSGRLEVLETEAPKLVPEERTRLADRLIASLVEDAEIEEAWVTEVERRITETGAGRVSVVPTAETIGRARDALVRSSAGTDQGDA